MSRDQIRALLLAEIGYQGSPAEFKVSPGSYTIDGVVTPDRGKMWRSLTRKLEQA